MNRKKIAQLILALLCTVGSLDIQADNPLVPNVGMADPHMYVFNNKVYLFATRDADSTAHQFVMPDWNIWTSEDLISWKLERTILPTETYMGESTQCWATETAYKNGVYYFYFSNGNEDTGVMTSVAPTGPYTDALGKPLLPKDLTPIKEYDPTILVDDDKNRTAYIAFGHHRSTDDAYYYAIAKLNDDMISLAESPKEIKIIGAAPVLEGNDKPNLHKRNGIYYLSAGSHYAMSENIYGPYTKTDNSGNNTYGLDAKAHGNYFEWNNQWFHTWCHFHLGKDVARYRESYLSYLHYKDNGEMVTDVDYLEAHFTTGVGQYDARWEKIEAEWYMAATNVDKRECSNGGFEISKIRNKGSLYFPHVKNLKDASKVSFRASSNAGGIIEVRADNAGGKLLGKCQITDTGGWDRYNEFSCALEDVEDVENIHLIFIGADEDLFHLDWFKFHN